jgi:hypothetical protein
MVVLLWVRAGNDCAWLRAAGLDSREPILTISRRILPKTRWEDLYLP